LAGILVHLISVQYMGSLIDKEESGVRVDAVTLSAVLEKNLAHLNVCAAGLWSGSDLAFDCGAETEIAWAGGDRSSSAPTASGWNQLERRESLTSTGSFQDDLILSVSVVAAGREALTVRRRMDLAEVVASLPTADGASSRKVILYDAKFHILSGVGKGVRDDVSSSQGIGPAFGEYANISAAEGVILPIAGNGDATLGYLRVSEPQSSIRDVFLPLVVKVISITFLVFIGMSLLIFLVTMVMVKPIVRLTKAARRVSNGDYGARVKSEGVDEIGELAGSFNHMAKTVSEKIEELKHKEREQRDFMAYVSHELNSPISVVRWNIELLAEVEGEEAPLSERRKDIVSDVDRVTGRMKRLIKDLSDASRLGRGVMSVSLKRLDVAAAASSAVESLSRGADEKGIALDLEVQGLDGGAFVSGDAERLAQVLENLVGNAIKYTDSDGKVKVVLRPTDDGRGIPESDQDKIFQRFFRARNASERETTGSGLGLYVSRELARLMGGDITFTSEVGVGSEFTLTLPEIGMS
jgi:signal transduction histidine kinase